MFAELNKNPKLKATLSALLPLDTDLKDAAKGFGQLRQFVASVHAAKNMNIPFSLLKATMTNRSSKGLREAIAELRPIDDAGAAVKKAEQQANEDMKN